MSSRSSFPLFSQFVVLSSLPILMMITGCFGSSSGLYPVTGKLTFKGKPLEGAAISFVGQGEGRPATAISKSDGAFDMYTLDSRGVLPGNYKVIVSKADVGTISTEDAGMSASGQDLSMDQSAANSRKAASKAKDLVPLKYGNPQTTPLQFEVKSAGNNVCDLSID